MDTISRLPPRDASAAAPHAPDVGSHLARPEKTLERSRSAGIRLDRGLGLELRGKTVGRMCICGEPPRPLPPALRRVVMAQRSRLVVAPYQAPPTVLAEHPPLAVVSASGKPVKDTHACARTNVMPFGGPGLCRSFRCDNSVRPFSLSAALNDFSIQQSKTINYFLGCSKMM